MQRQLQSDLEDAERRIGTEYVVDDHDARPMHDPDPHRRARSRGQPVGIRDRAGAQLVEVEIRVAELEEPGPELVLIGVPVLFYESMRLQRLEQPVDRWTRQPEPVGQLADAQPAGPARERLEDCGGAIDRLDRRTPGFVIIRHC